MKKWHSDKEKEEIMVKQWLSNEEKERLIPDKMLAAKFEKYREGIIEVLINTKVQQIPNNLAGEVYGTGDMCYCAQGLIGLALEMKPYALFPGMVGPVSGIIQCGLEYGFICPDTGQEKVQKYPYELPLPMIKINTRNVPQLQYQFRALKEATNSLENASGIGRWYISTRQKNRIVNATNIIATGGEISIKDANDIGVSLQTIGNLMRTMV